MYLFTYFVYLQAKYKIMNELVNNQKYLNIYTTGKNLFWKYGIKRVTIEEICKEAGVSKMTFYKFFPNKIELAKTIWEKIVTDSLADFRNVVNSEDNFQEKVKKMFAIKLHAAENISIEFINDIYKLPEIGLQKKIEDYGNQSLQIFIDFLKKSQKAGWIRKEIKIEFILYYFNQMSQMLDNKELLSKYNQPHSLIMEAMNFLFYGLSPQK